MFVVFNEILSQRYICLWSLFLVLYLLLNNVYIEKVLKTVLTNNAYKIHI